MTGTEAGAIVAAAGLVPLLTASRRQLRLAGLAVWVAGMLILAGDLLHSPIAAFRVDASNRPALAAAAAVFGIAALAVGGWIAHRWPTLVLMAVVAAAPARIPLHAGGAKANLLVPLYAVIAAVVVAAAYELVSDRERPPVLGPIGWAAAALIGWSAISLLWSPDGQQGGVQMLFFYLPFGFLLSRLAAIPLDARRLRWMLTVQVALGLVFAAAAFWQYATKDVFWNQKIIVSNEYASFFRVNSLFYDASIYGRFMAVTIVLLAAVAVYRRVTPQLVALMAVLFVALDISYSQSAMLALAAGAALIAATIWSRRAILVLVAVVAVTGVAGLALSGHGKSASDVTSGRSTLLSDGWHVIRHHPLAGAGLGGFARAALAGSAHPGRVKSAASHTTPVTVLAELGPLGLAAYLALIGSVAWAALRRGGWREARFGALAGLTVILASSVFYNAYFEDPASWILTAVIAALALSPVPALEATA